MIEMRDPSSMTLNNIAPDSRLIVFGDSYAANYHDVVRDYSADHYEKHLAFFDDMYDGVIPESWIEVIARKLKLSSIQYYSLIGSSIHYTMTKFIEYYLYDYRETDVIVISVTDLSRSPIVNNDVMFPTSSHAFSVYSEWLNRFSNFDSVQNIRQIYKNFHQKYHMTLDTKIGEIPTDIHSFILTLLGLPNVVVMTTIGSSYFDTFMSTVDMTKYKSKYYIEQSLGSISFNEYGYDTRYNDGTKLTYLSFIERYDGIDYRFNHISGCNHLVLGEMISECVCYDDIHKFDPNRFHKEIIVF